MPIYEYRCPEGHTTEFLKLSADDIEPTCCSTIVGKTQERTGQIEYFECGLPLSKTVPVTSFTYTRGKNPNWPL